jgi:hypothetical protein
MTGSLHLPTWAGMDGIWGATPTLSGYCFDAFCLHLSLFHPCTCSHDGTLISLVFPALLNQVLPQGLSLSFAQVDMVQVVRLGSFRMGG